MFPVGGPKYIKLKALDEVDTKAFAMFTYNGLPHLIIVNELLALK